jgi:hypothetical protein
MSGAWRDAGTLAQIARWGLFADAAVAGVAVAMSATMGIEESYFGDFARTFGIVQIVASLGSLILFLIWFYRANANVRAMGADGLMGSPGLSVAWFFIPIAFLFMPFVVVRDTWKASAAPRDWQAQPTDPLIGFWWVAFLVSHLAGTISFRLAMEGDYDTLGAIGIFDLISNLAAIPAALLGALLVTRIQKLQVSPAHLSEHFR